LWLQRMCLCALFAQRLGHQPYVGPAAGWVRLCRVCGGGGGGGGGVHQVEIPSGRVGSSHPCNACLGSTGGVAVQ
jgi:hypothetical protein